MYKISLFILLSVSIKSFAQIDNGYFIGYERMCWVNNKGKQECYDAPRKWYHKNYLLIQDASIYLYKIPIQINRKDTLYSASDGGFYYFAGKIEAKDSIEFISMLLTNCDYCGRRYRVDSISGFNYPIIDTLIYEVKRINTGLIMNGVDYEQQINDSFPISKRYFDQLFKFDENSIYRVNPKEQYDLVNQSINDYFKKDSITNSDSILICIDRYDNEGNIIETLNPNYLNDSVGEFKAVYLTLDDIIKNTEEIEKPFRYLMIGKIIDYKLAARISLDYNYMIPSKMTNFKGKEFTALYEYKKIGKDYILLDDSQTGWRLISQCRVGKGEFHP